MSLSQQLEQTCKPESERPAEKGTVQRCADDPLCWRNCPDAQAALIKPNSN